MSRWIPLHVHSQYSILDSTASIEELVEKAVECEIPSLALTDQGNLFGAIDFYKLCKKRKVKPIIGCELFVSPDSRYDKKRKANTPHGFNLVLLVKNKRGYQNLCKLSSFAHIEGFYYTPRIDKELLFSHAEGLICMVGGMRSIWAHLVFSGRQNEIQNELEKYLEHFKDDFYFEFTRQTMSIQQMEADGMDKESWLYQSAIEEFKREKQLEQVLRECAKKWNVSCVATNDSKYIYRDDWKAHEILLNIQSGEPCEIWERDGYGNAKRRIANPKRKVCYSHELYFKFPQEMEKLFADFPDAIEETCKIEKKCDFEFDFKTKYYPVFIPPGFEAKLSSKTRAKEAEKFLKDLCFSQISVRYHQSALEKIKEKYPDKDPLQVVKDRLTYELDVIISKGLCDYILIVYDFIAWAKKRKIPVGPGRGSGVGSIICYLTEITDLEPLRFNLFFERFINPERISDPDIDVDMCMDRRPEVIEYTIEKYGKEKVAQIITFGTMKAKMAIKDVGRVLSIPLSKINAVAKLIPEDPNITLDKALETDPDLKNQYETDEEIKEVIDLAKKLEGCIRGTGTHAAGLIICADPLLDHIPLCTAKDTEFFVTQFSMKPVEEVGMLKIDFLGLKTLTAIQIAVDEINAKENLKNQPLNWVNLPLDDKRTFNLLNQGKTLGIFQLESAGMRELAKQLYIDKFEDIMAVAALYRPGPMEMIPAFLSRKHGREPIEIDHPLMKNVLSETYGIMVYQEQVLQLANLLAKYTLGEGDMLRRAMGKKDHSEMNRQREKFRKGALENGIDEETAMQIFDKIEKFASYGFNKSHAAAYAYLIYVTAYLKANYPHYWMAALMTTDRDDQSKVTKIIRECRSMEIAILPPDMNESEKFFVATSKGIRFALSAIKGVGEAAIEIILKERKEKGPFQSFPDFINRVNTGKIGKKTIELLIEAGCFDFLNCSRAVLIESSTSLYDKIQKEQKEAAKGVLNLFSLSTTEDLDISLRASQEVAKIDLLKKEKELLGFYLSGHPLDEYLEIFSKLSCIPLHQIVKMDSDTICRTAFVIENIAIKLASKTGKKFAVLNVSDGFANFEIPIWSDLYHEKQDILTENRLIYAILQIESSQGDMKISCRWVADLTLVDEVAIKECDLAFERLRGAKSFRKQKKQSDIEKSKKMLLKMDADKTRLSHILQLKEIFQHFPGNASIRIEFLQNEKPLSEIFIDSKGGVEVSEDLKEKITSLSPTKQCTIEEE
ncbi:MAG: DNA polymerase III subunit alpha [Chlamydiae bacterium]|nr:DNA polymerase III subunit alpha [Chlamydiota bacterium]